MIFLIRLCILVLLGLSYNAQDQSKNEIFGKWKAEEIENSTIEIYQDVDGLIYGRIVQSDVEEWLGKIILQKISYDREENLWRGQVFSLKRQIAVDLSIKRISKDEIELVGKKWLFTKTMYWKRA